MIQLLKIFFAWFKIWCSTLSDLGHTSKTIKPEKKDFFCFVFSCDEIVIKRQLGKVLTPHWIHFNTTPNQMNFVKANFMQRIQFLGVVGARWCNAKHQQCVLHPPNVVFHSVHLQRRSGLLLLTVGEKSYSSELNQFNSQIRFFYGANYPKLTSCGN